MRRVEIWDLPTRVFHWSLAALVVLALVIGDDDAGIAFTLHAYASYGILFLLAFRIPWGLVGSPRSRFSDFVKSRREVLGHAKSLVLKLKAPRTVGHNPLGGWMIVALLIMVFLAAVTGLFAGDDEARGPYAGLLGGAGDALGKLHETLADLLIPLILLHLAGALVHWLLSGDNVIRAMIDGGKQLEDSAAALEPPLVRPWRAIVVIVLVVVLGGLVIAGS
jgi:cytochrome b